MSWFGNLFKDKKTTESNSTSSAESKYGLTPDITDYAHSAVANQYNPANYAQTAAALGPNQYQLGAASGLNSFLPQLGNAATSAWNISNNGFTPADIQAFQSPYTQSVVNATQAQFDTQNAIKNTQAQAQAAKLGALTGTQPGVQRALNSYWQQQAQAPVIAGLYNQGFNTAADLAAKNAATKISAFGAGNAAANTALQGYAGLGAQGQGLWNVAQTQATLPYTLTSEGAKTYAQLSPFSGTSQTGTNTGTQTTTGQSSPFSILANMAGLGIAGYNAWNKRRDGGAVSDVASNRHDRFEKAFTTIRGMLTKANGGSVFQPFTDGGEVGQSDTTTTRAPTPWKSFGESLQRYGADERKNFAATPDDDLLKRGQAQLAQMMAGMQALPPRPGFSSGGSPGEDSVLPPLSDVATEVKDYNAIGTPYTVPRQAPTLTSFREPFRKELADPDLRARLYALAHAEVGAQGPDAQQAFVESVMNRAAARNKSLSDTIHDRNYFPPVTMSRVSAGIDPSKHDYYSPIVDKVLDGSNVSRFATGNASGTVGFNKGPQTVAFNGERFGIEGPDQKWARQVSGYDAGVNDPAVTRSSLGAPDVPAPPRRDAEVPGRSNWLGNLTAAPGPSTGLRDLGLALMSVRGPMFEGPTNGAASAVMGLIKSRQDEARIQQEAARMAGVLANGQPTLEKQRLIREAEASAGRATLPDGTSVPTLAGQKAPSEIAAQEAHSEAAQLRIAKDKARYEKELKATEQLRSTMSQIDDMEMWKVIAPEEAVKRRQAARDLYDQTRGLIEGTKAPQSPVPTPAPGSSRTWTPNGGLSPTKGGTP